MSKDKKIGAHELVDETYFKTLNNNSQMSSHKRHIFGM